MSTRQPGYYWITWTVLIDAEVARRKPGPLVARWDGRVWRFVGSEVCCFDCEVEVLGNVLAAPQQTLWCPIEILPHAAGI